MAQLFFSSNTHKYTHTDIRRHTHTDTRGFQFVHAPKKNRHRQRHRHRHTKIFAPCRVVRSATSLMNGMSMSEVSEVTIARKARVDFTDIFHALKAAIVPFLNEPDCVVLCQLNKSVKTSVQDCYGETRQVVRAFQHHGPWISLMCMRLMDYFQAHLPAEWLAGLTLKLTPNEPLQTRCYIVRPFGKLVSVFFIQDQKLGYVVKRYSRNLFPCTYRSSNNYPWQCGRFWPTMKYVLDDLLHLLDLLDRHVPIPIHVPQNTNITTTNPTATNIPRMVPRSTPPRFNQP